MHFIFTGAHALCSALHGSGGLGIYYVLELLLVLIAWKLLKRISPQAFPVALVFISWIIANTVLWLVSALAFSLQGT